MQLYLKLILISILPIAELRGSIPVGLAHGMNPFEVWIISSVASTLPVGFLILSFRKIILFLEKFKILKKWVKKLNKRIDYKSKSVLKFKYIGLYVLVAIPIPGTGAWTGAMVASVLKMRLIYSIIVIFFGNLTAGLIVLQLTQSIFNIF